jgi:hypothetical protein
MIEARDTFEIRKRMPVRFRMGNWRLIYQLSTHGCSYQTFYKNIEHQCPLVIAIKTDEGERIGCFLSTELKISRGYLGTPEAFVFRWGEGIEVFGGQGNAGNQFFAAGGRNELVVGGGRGSAIWVGGNMQAGTSQECETYRSPALTKKEQFKIVDIEVWVIGKYHY